jgi:hypothetical protein
MSTNTGLRAARAEAGARPGLMTMAMRAMSEPEGPRVLRIGKVEAGRVIEERLLRRRGHVTVGTGHANTLVASGPGVPESMRLFELVGDHYLLRVDERLRGRVASAAGVIDVAEARAQGAQGASATLPLSDDARGRVVLGETTFLFQMVAPPPKQARPQLPLSVTGAAGRQVDWVFTIVAACSFLLHFGFASAVNGEWFDPIVDDDQAAGTLIQAVRDHGPPPPLESPRVEPKPDPTSVVATKGPKPTDASPTRTATPTQTARPSDRTSTGPSRTAQNDAIANRLNERADDLVVSLLGTPGASEGPIASTLKPGSVTPIDQVDEVAKQTPDGVAIGGPRLRNQDRPASNLPATVGPSTLTVGPKIVATAAPSTTSVVGPAVPKVDRTDPTTIAPGFSGADAVVGKNRWRYRGCYAKALEVDPDAGGTVNVTVSVNAEGKVTSATSSGGSPSLLGSCTAGAFKQMEFPVPEGGPTTFNVKIVYASKR